MSGLLIPKDAIPTPPTPEEREGYSRFGRGDVWPWTTCPMCGRRVAVDPTRKFVYHGGLDAVAVRRRQRARVQ